MKSVTESVLVCLWCAAAIAIAGNGLGCEVSAHGHYDHVDVVDAHGYHHTGYYDEHHDWHGGYTDEGHVYHDDAHDWHQ